VLEVIASASQVVGRNIPYEIAPRRPGDTAAIWADPSLAKKLLGWSAGRTLDQMCEDHWRWQKNNQTGYDEI
jgi:UDP-glucose 4-epimerase